MTKEVFIIDEDYAFHSLKKQLQQFRWILSPDDAYQGGTSLLVQEMDYSTPEPSPLPIPIPPTPPGKPRSIMVPLYDVHISLMNADNSSVELVYKPNKANIKVGLHLGMVASGVFDLRGLLAEKVQPRSTPQKPLTIGETPSNTATTTTHDEEQRKLLAMVTLVSSGDEHTTLDVSKSLEAGQTYTIEPLQEGWYRLTLHLSNLTFVDELRKSQGPSYDAMSTIVLSQLGITLTYENDDASTLGAEADFSTQSLVTLGSFAVVPSWSLNFHGSCVIGVTSKDSRVSTISQPETASRQKAQEETFVETVDEGEKEWLKVSSTLKWNVGHVVLPTQSSSSVSSAVATPDPEAQQISTSDCSHYCVYLSAVDDPNQAQFVGTAFTTQYRISNFELQAPKEEATPTPAPSPPSPPSPPAPRSPKVAPARKIKAFIQGVFKDREDAQPGGSTEAPTRKIWAFVQGVCRDGRADSADMWAKCLI